MQPHPDPLAVRIVAESTAQPQQIQRDAAAAISEPRRDAQAGVWASAQRVDPAMANLHVPQ